MRDIFFRSVTRENRFRVRHNLRNNPEHRLLSWSGCERLIVWCSTHYISAMLCLWGAALSSLTLALYLRHILSPFASQYLKGIKELPLWMPNLLGGQLTVIGIVFPLVVGLISVFFQKKSTREHIQNAFQLYSGYMFAGLSGLSLSAFILLGGLASAHGDLYLNIAFAIISFFWMILNIALSVWFFTQSLNILDDNKRNRIMLKYFHSHIIMEYITAYLNSKILREPQSILPTSGFSGVTILQSLPWKGQEEFECLREKIKPDESVRDIYVWPLKVLLHWLSASGEKKGEIVIRPFMPGESGYTTFLAYKNVSFPPGWRWMFRRCFLVKKKRGNRNFSLFTREFFGEIYDALGESNLGAFEGAADRLIDTYTRLRNSSRYEKNYYLDELKVGSIYYSFSISFHQDLMLLGAETVRTTENTSQYFMRLIRIPSSLFDETGTTDQAEFIRCINTLGHLWDTLCSWKSSAGKGFSESQEQRQRELTSYFIGVYESRLRSLKFMRKNGLSAEVYRQCLMEHLLRAAQIVVSAVESDDLFAADNATDHINIWFNQTGMDGWEAEYDWHSVILTPDWLSTPAGSKGWVKLLRGHNYDEDAALRIAYRNAATDLRLLTAAYIQEHVRPGDNVVFQNVLLRLLNNEMVYPTGNQNTRFQPIHRMSDIIDIVIRIEAGSGGNDEQWYGILTSFINRLSGKKDNNSITGRVYSSIYTDVRSLYPSITRLALMLPSGRLEVSPCMKAVLDDGLLLPAICDQLVIQLGRLKGHAKSGCPEYITDPDVYPQRTSDFYELVDKYLDAINKSRIKFIRESAVNEMLLRDMDARLTREFRDIFKKDLLLSFLQISVERTSLTSCFTIKTKKEINKYELVEDSARYYLSLMSTDEVFSKFFECIMDRLSRVSACQVHEINDIDFVINKAQQLTDDFHEYVLVLSGKTFFSQMRQIEINPGRQKMLNIYQDQNPVLDNYSPFRVNNCLLHACNPYGKDFALLLYKDFFRSLSVFCYPDETFFTCFWLADNDESIKGNLFAVCDINIELIGTAVARFNPEKN